MADNKTQQTRTPPRAEPPRPAPPRVTPETIEKTEPVVVVETTEKTEPITAVKIAETQTHVRVFNTHHLAFLLRTRHSEPITLAPHSVASVPVDVWREWQREMGDSPTRSILVEHE